MAAMKKSLVLLACVLLFPQFAADPARAADARALKDESGETVERNAKQIAAVGDALFYFGELGMQEVESARFLKETLEGIGYTVEVGGAGMPTNVWAKWGKGRPVIAIVSEMDA